MRANLTPTCTRDKFTVTNPKPNANEMALWNWILESLGYAKAQDEQPVKLRTKDADDGWLHVSVPKTIPEFEDRWVEVRKPRSEASRLCVNGAPNLSQ